MPSPLYINQSNDERIVQISGIEGRFHVMLEQSTGKLSNLDASALHQPLLGFLVGLGLVLHSFQLLFLLILEDTKEALRTLLDTSEIPEADLCNTANKSPLASLESRAALLIEPAVEEAVVFPGTDREPDSSIQMAESDAERIGFAPQTIDASSVSNASSATAVVPKVSREDIILQRLATLTEERYVSPLIFAAAKRQDHLTCLLLIEEGVDREICGPGGRSLTHVAAITGNAELLLALTSSSKRIWSTCCRGKMPLDYAAINGHLDIVTHLVKHFSFSRFREDLKLSILDRSTDLARSRGHISVETYLFETGQLIRCKQKEALFNDAVANNNIKRVQNLLKEGISKYSALWEACERGYAPLVSVLLSSIFDGFSYDITTAIDLVSKTRKQDLLVLLLCGIVEDPKRKIAARRAYQQALSAGQVEIGEFLVRCGEVDVQYAFRVAAEYQNLHLLRWLIEKEGKDAFHGLPINCAFHTAFFADSSTSLPVIKFLVENGADVNSKHKVWGSALQHAAAKGYLDLVRYLVDQGGADINAPGGLGGSGPMMAAVSGGHYSTFRYFLGLGICLEDQHGIFGNILQTASYLGRGDIFEDIMCSNFDIDARLKQYGSALMMAIQGGNFNLAQILISQGANINVMIPKYGTALHVAAAGGIENIVKSLIRAGAHMDIEGGEFGTPLQAAAANGHKLVVLFLLDCGAKINAQGGRYGNALQAAQEGGHSLLVRLLLFSGAK